MLPPDALARPDPASLAAQCTVVELPSATAAGQSLKLTAGGILSILTVPVAVEPVAAPEFPALSIAVQVTVVDPSALTLSDALALVVPRPVGVPTDALVQSISVIVLPPVVESSAVTEPTAGEVVNQPFTFGVN